MGAEVAIIKSRSFTLSSFNCDSSKFGHKFESTGMVTMCYLTADVILLQEVASKDHGVSLLDQDPANGDYELLFHQPAQFPQTAKGKELFCIGVDESKLSVFFSEVPQTALDRVWFRLQQFACVDFEGVKIWIINVHMHRGEKQDDFDHLASVVKSLQTKYFVIVGDFNTHPKSNRIVKLCKCVSGQVVEPDYLTTFDENRIGAIDFAVYGSGLEVIFCGHDAAKDFPVEVLKEEWNHKPIQFEVTLKKE